MNIPEIFFVFDVEAIGLHGQGFAVAGGVYRKDGLLFKEFAYHCPEGRADGEWNDREWVKVNVTINSASLLCTMPSEVRECFWREWGDAKERYPDVVMAVECGWPVEARFLIGCIQDNVMNRKWRGPYPLHEIASIMMAAGMDPMKQYERLPNELPEHEPLADSRLSARLLFEALHRLEAK